MTCNTVNQIILQNNPVIEHQDSENLNELHTYYIAIYIFGAIAATAAFAGATTAIALTAAGIITIPVGGVAIVAALGLGAIGVYQIINGRNYEMAWAQAHQDAHTKDNEVSLPQEMYEEIFSYLTGPELTKCSQVSK